MTFDFINMFMITETIKLAYKSIFESIIAYHGTSGNFDKFEMSKVGTGEAVNKYGHGLYFTADESVAKYYANRAAGDGKVYQVKLFASKSNHVLWNFDDTVESIKSDVIEIAKLIIGKEQLETLIEEMQELKSYGGYDIEETIDEILFDGYNDTNWENLEESLDEDLDETGELIPQKINELRTLLKKTRFEFSEATTIGDFYKELSDIFGSEENASKFLLRYGIDGFEYNAFEDGSMSKNYVIFDENDVKII